MDLVIGGGGMAVMVMVEALATHASGSLSDRGADRRYVGGETGAGPALSEASIDGRRVLGGVFAEGGKGDGGSCGR